MRVFRPIDTSSVKGGLCHPCPSDFSLQFPSSDAKNVSFFGRLHNGFKRARAGPGQLGYPRGQIGVWNPTTLNHTNLQRSRMTPLKRTVRPRTIVSLLIPDGI